MTDWQDLTAVKGRSPAATQSGTKWGDYVWLNVLPDQHWIQVRVGSTVWEALQGADIQLEGDCGGLGKCGKCKIRVVSAIGPPCKEEKDLLRAEQFSRGIRLACRTRIEADMQIEVGEYHPDAEFNQILKTGRGRILDLDPPILFRAASLSAGPDIAGLSDLTRVKRALGSEYSGLSSPLDCLRTLPEAIATSRNEGAAILHENTLLAWRPRRKIGKQYGIAYDLGTTTVVGKLLSLLDTREVAVISCVNSQIKFGSDVMSRLHFVKDHDNGLQQCRDAMIGDLERITRNLLEVGRLEPDDVFVSVVAGNTTMQHFLLGLPPLGIAQAPFSPVLTDGIFVTAKELDLPLHPEARVYVMPMCSGYIGGDLTGVLLASGAMEKDHQMVLGLDLGTNGEIFLGNSKRLLTCSAAAGPALEGARITHGMIARSGAIEGVRIENGRLTYRVIGNIKPKGLCGSGLVDLVAVLLHCGVIDYEGLIQPAEPEVLPGLNNRIIERSGTFDFLIADSDESFDGTQIYLTQRDVRELQLAKGAVAAGVMTLINEIGIGIDQIDLIHLAGALGNYIHPLSAIRIGLIPPVDINIIESIGNGALTGASMVLLSRKYWSVARRTTESIEHVELSTRLDFNQRFVDNMNFPAHNTW